MTQPDDDTCVCILPGARQRRAARPTSTTETTRTETTRTETGSAGACRDETAPERDERRRYRARAHRALDTMADVLPVYHEVCGTVAYHYALNEVRRLRVAVSEQPLSVAELILLERSVEAQTFGVVRAIRQARGNSAEPDA